MLRVVFNLKPLTFQTVNEDTDQESYNYTQSIVLLI